MRPVRAGVQAVERAAEVARGRHAGVRAGRAPGGRRAVRARDRCSRSCRAGAARRRSRRSRGRPRSGSRRGSTTRSRSGARRTTRGSAPAAARRAAPATSAPSLTVDAAAKRVSASIARVAAGAEVVHPDPDGAVRRGRPRRRAGARASGPAGAARSRTPAPGSGASGAALRKPSSRSSASARATCARPRASRSARSARRGRADRPGGQHGLDEVASRVVPGLSAVGRVRVAGLRRRQIALLRGEQSAVARRSPPPGRAARAGSRVAACARCTVRP